MVLKGRKASDHRVFGITLAYLPDRAHLIPEGNESGFRAFASCLSLKEINVSLDHLVLLTPDDCAAMDQAAARKVTLRALMENAGRAVAREIRKRFSPCRVVVACGPGNNGGDGYVAARLLSSWGWAVRVAAVVPPRVGSAAQAAASDWHGPMVPFTEVEIQRADLVVDAVFGAGLARPVQAQVSAVLAAAKSVVAVDIPSGVDGASGELLGRVKGCDLTVTFVRRKPGHVMQPGAQLCGEVVCAEIGMPDTAFQVVRPSLWHNAPGLWRLPVQQVGDHKYKRGVVSLCGGAEMPGAARLSARAARRVGAGLVRIAAGAAAGGYRLGDPGLIVDDAPLSELLEDPRRKVWVCGPGLTEREAGEALPDLISGEKTVLADAGALAWGSKDLARLAGVSVITPHIGEFRKLFGDIEGSRIECVRRAADKIGAIVVMKGSDTLVAAPGGRIAINDHASSALATAGSGDTLTGVIAALMASGMAAWEASCAGVWIHGEAGIRAGSATGGWPIAEDLDLFLGEARKRATAMQEAVKAING